VPERGPRSPAALVRSEERLARTLGVPALYAITGAAIGSSIYFALGVVARSALDLTPIAFLVAAAFFAVTAMTYVEGSSLHPERGGATTFARYAFDELWSFVAGWAILLDYLIVIAIGAVALSRHLGAFWGTLAEPAPQLLVAALALAVIVRANVRGLVAARLGRVLLVQLLNGALLLAVIVAGIFAVIGEPRAGGAAGVTLPSLDGFVFAAAVASAGWAQGR
jgi:APA family basic amino acid/polyamine antiporter